MGKIVNIKMIKKGIKPKLRFTFNIDDEIPVLDFEVPLKKKESKKKKIVIIKSKRNGTDSSTDSTRLF